MTSDVDKIDKPSLHEPVVGRVPFKGRLKAPKRNLLATTTAEFPILKNELTVHGGAATVVTEVDSTALPQPFLNPDRPLGQ